MLSYEYIQFLNQKVQEFLPSKRWVVGDKINFRCPLCGDGKTGRKHRAWWYTKNGSFYCFNCGTGLSGIKFLEAISGESYKELKQEYTKLFLKSGLNGSLSSSYDVPEEEPSLFNLKRMVLPEWKQPLSDKAREYLDKRLVTKAPFYQDNLFSWTSKKGNEYILIDWIVNGVDAYFQLNDFQKLGSMKYIFPKDSKKLVAGLDNIDMSWNKIIVFEGFYDSLFVKNGICTGTKSITQYQLDLIRERYPNHQICVSFDNDLPGFLSTKKLLEQNNDFKYFKWYNDNTKQKDINDYVLYRNDVNIFTDTRVLDRLICDKLQMKLSMVKSKNWNANVKKSVVKNGPSSFWEKRKIQ